MSRSGLARSGRHLILATALAVAGVLAAIALAPGARAGRPGAGRARLADRDEHQPARRRDHAAGGAAAGLHRRHAAQHGRRAGEHGPGAAPSGGDPRGAAPLQLAVVRRARAPDRDRDERGRGPRRDLPDDDAARAGRVRGARQHPRRPRAGAGGPHRGGRRAERGAGAEGRREVPPLRLRDHRAGADLGQGHGRDQQHRPEPPLPGRDPAEPGRQRREGGPRPGDRRRRTGPAARRVRLLHRPGLAGHRQRGADQPAARPLRGGLLLRRPPQRGEGAQQLRDGEAADVTR